MSNLSQRIEIVERYGQWSWVYYSTNGHALCQSSRTYTQRSSCVTALTSVRAEIRTAKAILVSKSTTSPPPQPAAIEIFETDSQPAKQPPENQGDLIDMVQDTPLEDDK